MVPNDVLLLTGFATMFIVDIFWSLAKMAGSYTAGDLMPLGFGGPPAGCLRSSNGYAVQVAKALGAAADLVDAACTNAGVKDMTSSQRTYLGTNPPQLNVLKPGDSLVMLTLGGDDIGAENFGASGWIEETDGGGAERADGGDADEYEEDVHGGHARLLIGCDVNALSGRSRRRLAAGGRGILGVIGISVRIV